MDQATAGKNGIIKMRGQIQMQALFHRSHVQGKRQVQR